MLRGGTSRRQELAGERLHGVLGQLPAVRLDFAPLPFAVRTIRPYRVTKTIFSVTRYPRIDIMDTLPIEQSANEDRQSGDRFQLVADAACGFCWNTRVQHRAAGRLFEITPQPRDFRCPVLAVADQDNFLGEPF